MPVELGPYVVGEVPEPLEVTFQDSTGAALDLTGYTAKWTYQKPDGTDVTRTATIAANPATGQATYTWVAADIDQGGVFAGGRMWVGNGTNRFASVEYVWRAEQPLVAAPAI